MPTPLEAVSWNFDRFLPEEKSFQGWKIPELCGSYGQSTPTKLQSVPKGWEVLGLEICTETEQATNPTFNE